MWRFLREVFCRNVAHNLGYIARIGHSIHSSELLLNFGPESGNSGVTVWVFRLRELHDLCCVDFRLKLSWLMVYVIKEGERSNNRRVNPPLLDATHQQGTCAAGVPVLPFSWFGWRA